MVYGYTIRGSNSAIFIFASLLNGGQLIKERICSNRSKFFPLRVDPLLDGFILSGRKQEVIKVVPLRKASRKAWKSTHYLNHSTEVPWYGILKINTLSGSTRSILNIGKPNLMVYGYTIRGSNSAIFIFASLLNGGQLIKERICSNRSKFFPLRVDPLLDRFILSGRKQEVIKVVPLRKASRKAWKSTHYLNHSIYSLFEKTDGYVINRCL